MTHSTEPNDEPITPKPKIVQFQVMDRAQWIIALTDTGRLLARTADTKPWKDITGEIPISGNDSH